MTVDPQTFKQTHYIGPTTNWRNMKFDNGLFHIELSFNTGKFDEGLAPRKPEEIHHSKNKVDSQFFNRRLLVAVSQNRIS